MPGGLMNLIAYGNQNIILNGNPTKTFFKATYMKYTNFGLQKFRINHEGLRQLDQTKDTHYTFKMPRYGDLLMDTYLSVKLPHIWSPLYKRVEKSKVDIIDFNDSDEDGDFFEIIINKGDDVFTYLPYEFKWIEELGTQMIKEIRIRCGNTTLQQYSGEYISISAKRDYDGQKLDLFNEMIGNTPVINDPALPYKKLNTSLITSQNLGYPTSFFDRTSLSGGGPEPSIRGRELYIPIGAWFCNSSKQAFPMIASQYSELFIDITLRPLQELFVIRDVSNYYNGSQNNISYPFDDSIYNKEVFENNPNILFAEGFPYISPNFNLDEHAMYRFLHPPPNTDLDYTSADKRTQFNADIHLISTYGFLSEEEGRELAGKEQSILIKDVREYTFNDIVGTKKIELESTGLISNWTFFMRRNDVEITNQWNNYTNWRYNFIKPQNILSSEDVNFLYTSSGQLYDPAIIGKNLFFDSTTSEPSFIEPPYDYYASGPFNIENEKKILKNMEILLDGKIRESRFNMGVFQYIEPFQRTSGGFTEGLYVYNFGLKTDPSSVQPNGAINLSKFSRIELEVETEIPPLDPDAEFNIVCANVDNTSGNDGGNTSSGRQIIGVNKDNFRLYKYTYDMRLFEEKYNIVNFTSGHCGLMFSR